MTNVDRRAVNLLGAALAPGCLFPGLVRPGPGGGWQPARAAFVC